MKKRIAKDGLPFDIDNIPGDGKLFPEEVEVIQYLRPGGTRRRMAAPVGKETAKKAKDLIISAEELGTGQVALYVRKKGEPEEKEHMGLADNGPGENSPGEVLKRMIEKYA